MRDGSRGCAVVVVREGAVLAASALSFLLLVSVSADVPGGTEKSQFIRLSRLSRLLFYLNAHFCLSNS